MSMPWSSHSKAIASATSHVWLQNTDRGSEIITYVPMAVNKLRGQVTDLPRIFGYDYYYVAGQSSAVDENGMYIPEREIDPSPAYLSLASSQDYYYVIENTSERLVNTLRFGDVRRYMTLNGITINDSTFAVNRKFQRANIPVYRIPAKWPTTTATSPRSLIRCCAPLFPSSPKRTSLVTSSTTSASTPTAVATPWEPSLPISLTPRCRSASMR